MSPHIGNVSLPQLRGLALASLYALCFLACLYLTLPMGDFIFLLGLLLTYMVSPAGKETIIPMAIGYGLPWWYTALVFSAFDLVGSLFVALNFDLLVGIPLLGPWLNQFLEDGRAYLEKNRWVGRLYYIALVMYEMLLDGSAGITGGLLGRIMGMGPLETIASILAGSIMGCFLFARASELITTFIPRDMLFLVSFTFFIGLTLLSFLSRHIKNRRSVL